MKIIYFLGSKDFFFLALQEVVQTHYSVDCYSLEICWTKVEN